VPAWQVWPDSSAGACHWPGWPGPQPEAAAAAKAGIVQIFICILNKIWMAWILKLELSCFLNVSSKWNYIPWESFKSSKNNCATVCCSKIYFRKIASQDKTCNTVKAFDTIHAVTCN
jgi:hypothetical protein